VIRGGQGRDRKDVQDSGLAFTVAAWVVVILAGAAAAWAGWR
jgi:hypothetical protein